MNEGENDILKLKENNLNGIYLKEKRKIKFNNLNT